MANWESIMSNRATMGRARSLCLAMNGFKRKKRGWRGREETGGKSIFGEGDCPSKSKFKSGKGPREE